MIDVRAIMRNRILEKAGLAKVGSEGMPSLTELRKTERSPEFDKLRENRKILGAFRYGLLGARDKPQWDRISAMEKRLAEYRENGNLEKLVDVANLAEMEFVEGRHPNRHWSAEDDGKHVSKV